MGSLSEITLSAEEFHVLGCVGASPSPGDDMIKL
jgi:hypothetical protein